MNSRFCDFFARPLARGTSWAWAPCACTLVAMLLACATAAVAEERAGDDTSKAAGGASDDRLAAALAKARDIRDMSADFVETKKTVLLKDPLSSSGTVFASGGRTKWVTHEPYVSWLCTTAEHVTIYFPKEQRAERYAVDAKLRPLLISPVPQTDRLRDSFSIELVGSGGGEQNDRRLPALRLALRPKTEELRDMIDLIEVDIDEARGVASRVQISDADGDVTTIEFRNVRINTGVGDDDTDCTLPRGTDVADFSDGGVPRS